MFPDDPLNIYDAVPYVVTSDSKGEYWLIESYSQLKHGGSEYVFEVAGVFYMFNKNAELIDVAVGE